MRVLMERKMYGSLLLLFFLACTPVLCGAASDDANVYFNAGTEKYLQGNITESVENLEKAQALDPDNGKIKQFMVKILLEAATQDHLTRNYRQAYVYLEKAKKLDPDNQKVLEMYKLTQGLLYPVDEKEAQREKSTRRENIAEVKLNEKIAGEAAAARIESASALRQDRQLKLPDPSVAIPVKNQAIQKGALLFDSALIKDWRIWLFVILFLLSSLSSVIFLILFLFKTREAASYKGRLNGYENELKTTVEKRNDYLIELEKARESIKYEQLAAGKLQKDLKDINKKDELHIEMALDQRSKEIEKKVRSEIYGKFKSEDGQRENFINHQQERFLKYISDTSTPAEAETDPVLSSARERIALMAQNLYEYAPGAAVDFITKMARSENPSIRTNIVQALANIAKPETFELLFELYNDVDLRVKREVLRNLKQLNQKIGSGAVFIEAPAAEKIKYLIEIEKVRGEWIF